MVVSPKDSKSVYPANTWYSFTVELPRAITNACSKYRVALTHAFFNNRVNQVPFYHVYSSICASSVAFGRELAIIGQFFEKGAVNTPFYHNIAEDNIQRISFDVLTPTLETPSGESISNIYFCLHFELKK